MKTLFFVIALIFSMSVYSQAKSDTLYLKNVHLKWIEENNAGLKILGSDTTIMLKGKAYSTGQISMDNYHALINYKKVKKELSPIILLQDDGKRLKVYYTNGECILGPYREYYDTGLLKIDGSYDWKVYKRKLGTWKYYDETGKLTKEITYNDKGKK